MGSVDYRTLAGDILRLTGGEENLASFTHCATRLRLKLRDEDKADTAAVEKLPGVITVRRSGGQYQVVIGNNVPTVYAEMAQLAGTKAATDDDRPAAKGNILDRFIELISSILLPLLWPLAGAGLLKAFLAAATQFGWLSAESTTNVILAASADAIFYFLPVFLAVTSAKRFRADPFTAMAIAGTLVYPSIVALAESPDPVTFFGLPVVMMSYTSSLIPIIIAVWLQGYLERWLDRVLPGAIRNFTRPLLVLLIMVPLVLLTVGPATTLVANAVSAGVTSVFSFAPWLGGLVLGGLWQVLVMFGLHWGLVPVMLNDLTTQGFTVLGGPIPAAVLAQGAATLAVLLRSRSAKRRGVAGPAALSGILAGVTEPGIYGVNLPLKLPFYFGLAGGAIGGAVAAAGGSANTAFVFPSLLGLPAYMQVGNFTLQLIGCGLAMAIAFVLTFLFASREVPDADPAGDAPPAPVPADELPAGAGVAGSDGAAGTTATATRARVLDLLAPMSGRTIELAAVTDPVFSSGALGAGVGIVPSEGVVRAPVAGEVLTAAATGHAFGIRTEGGAEVLIHVGIDTVQLDGRHFEPAVKAGAHVRAGDMLGRVDLDAVAAAGYDTTTIVTVTNTAQLAEVLPAAPADVAAGDPVIAVQF
ncbi:beta-glucoside-specific PTS transporter subunit IIABC [Mobilicoccus caccae]|uniref:PTS beta-glucoside transporter subunit EIIBCA n=1 Tax=Mobilicoccus caccae TaxID=1859295 RepID=A0ABQ6IU99_9MICO|nr:beta-glucoside-specific PTS transporter subunit IIABC [Mobilicoccus caccae]GMA41510.1 PTS beta-glucoside transporter subunit EIIBCA [Mobilicoccus caccae]